MVVGNTRGSCVIYLFHQPDAFLTSLCDNTLSFAFKLEKPSHACTFMISRPIH